jgi:hypothetical protein
MATRRRIPMVGDHPQVVVPVEQPSLEVTLRVREELSSESEAKEFDWDAWSGLMIAALIVPRSTDALVDYWKANANMLDWAKKVKPDIYEKIRLAFADRKAKLQGGQHG